jgi:hypothetical protein
MAFKRRAWLVATVATQCVLATFVEMGAPLPACFVVGVAFGFSVMHCWDLAE